MKTIVLFSFMIMIPANLYAMAGEEEFNKSYPPAKNEIVGSSSPEREKRKTFLTPQKGKDPFDNTKPLSGSKFLIKGAAKNASPNQN